MEETKRFDSLELSQQILDAVADMSYTDMTEIQARSIPLILEGHDIIGRSSTGTGKTAAFGLPAVERMRECREKRPQVLVLSPTRELAMQISVEVSKFAKYTPNIRIATVYGGESMSNQFRELKTANFVVGTPGRIMDHMRRGTLKLDDLKMVILDEADEMLNMGFLEDIQTILKEAPKERQTLLFSATMPPAIVKIAGDFQKDPVIVAVESSQRTIDTIEQYYYCMPQSFKNEALNLVLHEKRNTRSVIFSNTKRMVDELVEYLNVHGHKAIGLHGDMKQSARTQVMNSFKSGRINILIATDVAARGIDVEDVEAVYNYDIPAEYEYYIHRVGRTGRAGKTGESYTFVCNREQLRRIKEISRFIHAEIKEQQLPTAEEYMAKSRNIFTEKLKRTLKETANPDRWMSTVEELMAEGHEAKDIAAALVAMMASKDKSIMVMKSIPPLRLESKGGRRGDERKDGRRDGRSYGNVSGGVTLRADVGSNQRMAPNFIVGAIVDATGVPAKSIGKIDIYPDYTLFDMPADDANIVLEKMQGKKIRSCPVTFTRSASRAGGKKPSGKSYGNHKKANERNKPYMKRRNK